MKNPVAKWKTWQKCKQGKKSERDEYINKQRDRPGGHAGENDKMTNCGYP